MDKKALVVLVEQRMARYGQSPRTRAITAWAVEEASRQFDELGPVSSKKAVANIVDAVVFEASFRF